MRDVSLTVTFPERSAPASGPWQLSGAGLRQRQEPIASNRIARFVAADRTEKSKYHKNLHAVNISLDYYPEAK
jgi:hypothetical protein